MVLDQRLVCSEMIHANAKASELEGRLGQTASADMAAQQLISISHLQERVPMALM